MYMYVYIKLFNYIYIEFYIYIYDFGGLSPCLSPEEHEHFITEQKVIGLGLCIKRDIHIDLDIHRYTYACMYMHVYI